MSMFGAIGAFVAFLAAGRNSPEVQETIDIAKLKAQLKDEAARNLELAARLVEVTGRLEETQARCDLYQSGFQQQSSQNYYLLADNNALRAGVVGGHQIRAQPVQVQLVEQMLHSGLAAVGRSGDWCNCVPARHDMLRGAGARAFILDDI